MRAMRVNYFVPVLLHAERYLKIFRMMSRFIDTQFSKYSGAEDREGSGSHIHRIQRRQYPSQKYAPTILNSLNTLQEIFRLVDSDRWCHCHNLLVFKERHYFSKSV